MTDLALDPLPPAPARTTTDEVFALLHRAIVTMEIAPGTKISEGDIARRLDVSRQPVRDAFFRLSTLGFLVIRPQRATLVTPITDDDVLHATFIRTALEIACTRAAVDAVTDADIAGLTDLLAQQKDAVARGDRTLFHVLDDAFHREICRIGGHAYAWPIIDEQKGHMDRVRVLSLMETQDIAYEEHTVILAALAARDAAAAADAQSRHIGRIATILPAIRERFPQHFD